MMRATAARGITLIEVAISMGLFTIVGMAVASMLGAGMDAQMAYRVHENEHNVAMNIIDRLRQDVIRARALTIVGGGTQVVITPPTGANITWSIIGGVVRRDGLVQSQSAYPNINLRVTCGGNGTTACFEGLTQNGAATTVNPKRLVLNELTVSQQLPAGGGSLLDHEFGPAAFRVNDVTFEMMPGTTFQ